MRVKTKYCNFTKHTIFSLLFWTKVAIKMYSMNRDSFQLLLSSFLMLFVELTLIRWIGSQIFQLFFFSNLILLASFLGMGLGFLRPQSRINLFVLSPFLLVIIITGAYYCGFQYQIKVNPITDNLDYSGMIFKNHLFPVWVTLPVVFISVTILMMTIANEVARQFQKFPPLQAYRLDILGSILGILAFALLSFSHTAPLSWGIVICLTFIFLLPKEKTLLFILQTGFLILILTTFALDAFTPHHFWSSYYKVDVEEYSKKRYAVNVNGLTQQIIESVEQRKQVKPFYLLPYEHRQTSGDLKKVLIIGAGTGGDVAIALAEGAQQVDAVEIDPRLYRLGQKLNPDHPYANPRVRVYINDGRAFLQQSQTQYDLIIFALTDALAMIPGQSSLRLENYLYTLESIEQVKKHLTPTGMFAIYNYYGVRWIVDRLATTMNQVFHQPPCLDTFSPQDYWATVLTIGNPQAPLQCKTRWQSQEDTRIKPTTDDHPFLYLQGPSIPPMYFLTLIFICLIAVFTTRRFVGSFQAIKHHLDFFLMGAAFLLLEAKSVVHFALLFGTTWFVNCLVFIGILSTVYISIEIAYRFSIKRVSIFYFLLIVSLLLAWKIPNSFLLSLPAIARFICASILTFSPILLANLIFSQRFSQQIRSTEAFGVNLLGAVLGGVLEYLSLVVGYQSLILLIAGLYLFVCIINMGREKQLTRIS